MHVENAGEAQGYRTPAVAHPLKFARFPLDSRDDGLFLWPAATLIIGRATGSLKLVASLASSAPWCIYVPGTRRLGFEAI